MGGVSAANPLLASTSVLSPRWSWPGLPCPSPRGDGKWDSNWPGTLPSQPRASDVHFLLGMEFWLAWLPLKVSGPLKMASSSITRG